MSRTVTYAIELAVGLGCCMAALRRRQVRWLGVMLLVAGAAAIAHAASRLAA